MFDKTNNILIVDDEEYTRLGYAEVLKLDGYKVDTAINGLDAYKKITKNNYDAIVTDLRMPEMDGISFIKKLNDLKKNIPVLVITAFGNYKSYKNAKLLGVIEYLNKPIRAKDLKDAIKKIVPD